MYFMYSLIFFTIFYLKLKLEQYIWTYGYHVNIMSPSYGTLSTDVRGLNLPGNNYIHGDVVMTSWYHLVFIFFVKIMFNIFCEINIYSLCEKNKAYFIQNIIYLYICEKFFFIQSALPWRWNKFQWKSRCMKFCL